MHAFVFVNASSKRNYVVVNLKKIYIYIMHAFLVLLLVMYAL